MKPAAAAPAEAWDTPTPPARSEVPDEAGAARAPRGPLRPEALASSRARAEIRAQARLSGSAESAAIIVLAVLFCARAHPAGVLTAPVADVLPFAIACPLLIASLTWTLAHDLNIREHLALALGHTALGFAGTGLAAAVLLAVLPVAPDQASAVAGWVASSAAMMTVADLVWWRRLGRLRRAGLLVPNIVIIGATAHADKLIARALETRAVAVLGVFDDRVGRVPADIRGVPVLGNTAALLTHRVMPSVDRVVIALPSAANERIGAVTDLLRTLPNEIALFLDIDDDAAKRAARPDSIAFLARLPVTRLAGRGIDERRILVKRAADLILGVVALVFALPIMLLVAVAVRLDSPGPVFFRQRRHGFNNETIVVWKFRSMRHDAADATAARQVAANDDRVTRVGRFIRKTSLDELPQLFNVLRGEMSLVGPRPHAIGMRTANAEAASLVAEYAQRHRIKPGMTSWAAIRGSRGPVATAEAVRARVVLDIDYIERQSFWFDLYIMLVTVPVLLGDRTAVR